MANNDITLRLPSKYGPPPSEGSSSSSTPGFTNPPLEWLHRTWTVTHSTLGMWRTARNVRITYKPLAPAAGGGGGHARVDDLVEYERSSGKGDVRTVAGVDTACGAGAADTGAWDWRGKGLLGFVTSHWEVLGWGERDVEGGAEGEGEGEGDGKERWAVTWFAPTLFTKEGVDLYSDRKGGMSEALAGEVLAALKGLGAKPLVDMVEADMQPVEIHLPWKEK